MMMMMGLLVMKRKGRKERFIRTENWLVAEWKNREIYATF